MGIARDMDDPALLRFFAYNGRVKALGGAAHQDVVGCHISLSNLLSYQCVKTSNPWPNTPAQKIAAAPVA